MSQQIPDRPLRTLPARRRQAARAQLEAVITGSGRRRLSRPAPLAAIVTGAVLIGSGTAAIAYQQFKPVTNTSQARCYTVASLAGDHYTTIAAATPVGSKSPARVRDALPVCADLWRQGFLKLGAPGIGRPQDTLAHHPVPRLVECTMPDGTAAVFPGGAGTCEKLGLARASNP